MGKLVDFFNVLFLTHDNGAERDSCQAGSGVFLLPTCSSLPPGQGLCLAPPDPISVFHPVQSSAAEASAVSLPAPAPTPRDFLLRLEIERVYPPRSSLISLSIFIKLSLWLQDKVNQLISHKNGEGEGIKIKECSPQSETVSCRRPEESFLEQSRELAKVG